MVVPRLCVSLDPGATSLGASLLQQDGADWAGQRAGCFVRQKKPAGLGPAAVGQRQQRLAAVVVSTGHCNETRARLGPIDPTQDSRRRLADGDPRVVEPG